MEVSLYYFGVQKCFMIVSMEIGKIINPLLYGFFHHCDRWKYFDVGDVLEREEFVLILLVIFTKERFHLYLRKIGRNLTFQLKILSSVYSFPLN